jgi:hypothetical protein
MPEHRPAPDAPRRAVDATIERVLETLTGDCDPDTLNEIRAAFRRKIPFRLRSYAAALLILEASGGRQVGRKPEGKRAEAKPRKEGPKGPRPEAQRARVKTEATPALQEESRPRFSGEATTLFFGMGKRQRLYPRVLLRILTENGGLAPEEIGDIRSFDNYSFADVDPSKEAALVAALEGFAFRGRVLPVSKARKRGAGQDETEAAAGIRRASGRDLDLSVADRANEAPEDVEELADFGEDIGKPYEGDESYDDGAGIDDDFIDSDEGLPEDEDETEDAPR